jgi:predicted RNase H-like nuclease
MTTLLVGFDSAWTPARAGGLVGVLRQEDGTYQELGPPIPVSFDDAIDTIRRWQAEFAPRQAIVLLDQPTVVRNATGQRPVENLVASPVSLRYGGVQPASTSRAEMFGTGAPVWRFLSALDGEQDPLARDGATRVLETYPVLAMIALGWTLPDSRASGRLPKYNPERRKTFAIADWRHVCERSAQALTSHGLPTLGAWMEDAGRNAAPRKKLQDGVDACLCLLVALHLGEGKRCLLIGNAGSGYMVVPDSETLRAELHARCVATGRTPTDWVRALPA